MIKLESQTEYLSLKNDENYELEDFSVITGVNGSGKTHLLKAINGGFIKVNGIDQSSIIYYNYNDFNLFYENIDEKYKGKGSVFLNKSLAFFNYLNNQRQEILDSYKVWNFDLKIPEYIFNELNFSILDFSDEEIENLKLIKFNSNEHPGSTKWELMESLGRNTENIDIKKLISDIKTAIIKNRILFLIRNLNYSFDIINWNISDLDKYELIKIENPSLTFGVNDTGLNENLRSFIYTIENDNILKYFEEGLIELKKYFIEIKLELENFFSNNAPSEYLELGNKYNESIIDPIIVDNGFLNLQEIAIEEKEYQLLKLENEYNEFRAYKGIIIEYLNDANFLERYGISPVDLLNEVLDEYDCNGYEFRQNQIDLAFGVDAKSQLISISLYNKKDDYFTSLTELSSGEKTLVALSFYLFKLKKNKIITRLLLLDEVDFALHPSMSKRLLEVLYNVFYKKFGIKIILTTHSPSTVAFTPEDSIFTMDKYSNPRLIKTTKDKALKELTKGVPSFSVNYENRRQVFVESDYDVEYYENLYNIFGNKLNSQISLNFISSGKAKLNGNGVGIASCDQVINIVTELRNMGNQFIWGIIDWDLRKNMPQKEFIVVLGFDKRYSIENFLFDPLLLAILLWREKILTTKDFEFHDNEKYFAVLDFGKNDLQKMIDKIVYDIKENVDTEINQELCEYELCNGIVLNIPKWYCEIQGHKLEDTIIKTYPKLNAIKRNDESALKKALLNKIIEDFSDLCPVDLLDVFRKIQEI